MPGCVPAGIRSFTLLPCTVFTCTVVPSTAWPSATGMSQVMSSPSRPKNRSVPTWKVTSTSLAGLPALLLGPCPLSRTRVPVSVAGGTVTSSSFWVTCSPVPAQVGHRSDGTLPRPRQTGHGRLTAKPPCPNEMVPRPLHSSQVVIVAPGAAPLPPQVGQASVIESISGILPPTAAVRNGTSTVTSTCAGRDAASSPRRFPKIDEKMSPSPNDPMSPKSISSDGGGPPRGRAPARCEAVSKAPSLRMRSYLARCSASASTVCASEISLKRSAALGSFGLASGWNCFASLR